MLLPPPLLHQSLPSSLLRRALLPLLRQQLLEDLKVLSVNLDLDEPARPKGWAGIYLLTIDAF
jgi:hypothetical protein